MTDRAKIGRRSRNKGATFERWVANQLKKFFPESRRQPQSQIKQLKAIMDKDDSLHLCLTDVVAGPFGIECKHRKQLPNMDSTLEQAQEDCGTSGKIPVGVHKPNGGTVYDIKVAIMYYGDVIYMGWLEFLTNCERISREKRKDDRGPMDNGQTWELFPPRAD
jgi:hypothetical protein